MTLMKRLSVLTLASAMLVTAAGCGSGNNNTPEPTKSPSKPSNEKQTEAPAETTTTYNIMRNISIPEYPSDGGEAKTKIIAELEKSGIKGFDYKINMAAGTEYYTKLNLLASSGELPDLFDIDGITLKRFVEQGLVLPLDDYLAKVPEYVELIPEDRWEQVTFDGKIYAIPSGKLPNPINHSSVTSILIREDWLKELNLEQPDTLDELYETLKAITAHYPGNNGLGGIKTSNFFSIFGAFGITPNFWFERDGVIKKGMVLPEAKEALAVLQKWYKEGLIDPDFPIMESKQLNEKIVNSKIGVWEGTGFMTHPQTNSTTEALMSTSPEAVLTMLETPAGPEGKRGYPESLGSLRAFSAKIEDPDKLLQVLNWMTITGDQGGGLDLVHYGVEGEDYTYDREKDFIQQSSSYSELYKKGYSNPLRISGISDRRYALPEVRGAIETATKHLIQNELWKPLQSELDYPDLTSKLWTEYFVKIVTGVYSVDKHDEFVEKYYAQGGDKVEQEANEEWSKLKQQ
ncbi:extracellular solute-binding protein [Paenibacillus sp. J5C_2022]|uniref:extracellular solute-binding protein n=1 Tax=Paenibacillus sp. J5C2022 TaxID=2977129 RepID=UPI0021D0EA1C|nr:extracellular solute-binding protein [Paenibacillus sp. J5C2022]MCU6711870.1 extracellular solute-binding protein [Paenibacillus sp. J5C2022]